MAEGDSVSFTFDPRSNRGTGYQTARQRQAASAAAVPREYSKPPPWAANSISASTWDMTPNDAKIRLWNSGPKGWQFYQQTGQVPSADQVWQWGQQGNQQGQMVNAVQDQNMGNQSDWRFVPQPPYNRPTPRQQGLGEILFARGHLGFGDSLQAGMDRMLDINMANASTMQRNRDRALQGQMAARDQDLQYAMQGRDLMLKNQQILAQLEAEKIRAQALAALFGMGGMSGRPVGKPRYTSNIGQSINWSGRR